MPACCGGEKILGAFCPEFAQEALDHHVDITEQDGVGGCGGVGLRLRHGIDLDRVGGVAGQAGLGQMAVIAMLAGVQCCPIAVGHMGDEALDRGVGIGFNRQKGEGTDSGVNPCAAPSGKACLRGIRVGVGGAVHERAVAEEVFWRKDLLLHVGFRICAVGFVFGLATRGAGRLGICHQDRENPVWAQALFWCRRSNRPGKLSGKRTGSGGGLWRVVFLRTPAEGITISGAL
jgi:hypothetical protein